MARCAGGGRGGRRARGPSSWSCPSWRSPATRPGTCSSTTASSPPPSRRPRTWPTVSADGPPVVVGTVARASTRPPRHPGLHNVAAVLESGRVVAAGRQAAPARPTTSSTSRGGFSPGSPRARSTWPVTAWACWCARTCGTRATRSTRRPSCGRPGPSSWSAWRRSPSAGGWPGPACAHARRSGLPLVHVSPVGAQDELVFDGRSFVLDAEGRGRRAAPRLPRGGGGGGRPRRLQGPASATSS